MMDNKDFYILGLPIDTTVGECQFLKVKEYPDYYMDLQIISLTKNHLINKYSELLKTVKDEMLEQLIDEMKKANLFQIVTRIPELQESYIRVFTKVFDNDDVLAEIDDTNFEYLRKLIMDMNWLKEEVVNPNPEIQKAIERSRRVKSSDGEKLEFYDIVSSVVGFNGLCYQDINEFTIYQLYMTFFRIAQIKNYDTSTLFATVSTDKIKIESWSKHIDFDEEESHAITKDEFEKKSESIFG